MPSWTDFLDSDLFRNTAWNWSFALIAFLVTFTVLPLIKGYISARRRKWIQEQHKLPAAIEIAALLVDRTSSVFLWGLALYFGASQLVLPAGVQRALDAVIVVLFWIQVGLWGMAAVRFFIERRRAGGPDPQLAGSIELILFIANVAIWATAGLLALANLGINIGPLLAGLGIGGIAVALAVQTVLGDLLASMSIALDKPFAVGDFLILDTFMGSVEHIGVKSTRLRSLSGEQIIMSNADILRSRVRNYGRMKERRVVFQLGVTYDTSADKLEAIPGEIRKIIEAQPDTRFDRCHFMTYGDSALQFETVYYVLLADFNTYANTHQAVNLAIFRRFAEMGVSFAFPTRTLQIAPPATGSLTWSAASDAESKNA